MRKMLSVLMTAFCILSLSSCASQSTDEIAHDIRDFFAEAGSVSMNIAVTADYGEKIYEFKLAGIFTGSGGTVTLTEPESVAGVTASVSPDGVSLSYDGAEVYTGELSGKLSPLRSIPGMVLNWSDGLITETVRENVDGAKCISVTFRLSDGVSLRTWFEEDTYLPLHAEFSSDGYTVISCDFENVAIK